MKKYKVISLEDFWIAEEIRSPQFKNFQMIEKETGDLYILYFRVHGKKSDRIVRVNPNNIFNPDRGQYVKVKDTYLVVENNPTCYK